MDAEDPESTGDLCAIPRGLPVRNSRCSLTHQPRHSALWPQPPGSTAPLLPHGGTDPEGLKERKPVAASPSSRPWASEVRKDTPGARPNPKANSPRRALNTPSDPHTAMHCLSLRSPRPRTTLILCRAEMSTVLRAATFAVLTAAQRAPGATKTASGETLVLPPSLSSWD